MSQNELSIMPLGSLDRLMSEQELNRPQVGSLGEQVNCVVIAEAMRVDGNPDLGPEPVQRDANDIRPRVCEPCASPQDKLPMSAECVQCIADNHRQGYCHGDRCFLLTQYDAVASNVGPSQIRAVDRPQASVEEQEQERLSPGADIRCGTVTLLPDRVASPEQCFDFPIIERLDLIDFAPRHLHGGGWRLGNVLQGDTPVEEAPQGCQFLAGSSDTDPASAAERDEMRGQYSCNCHIGKVLSQQVEQGSVVCNCRIGKSALFAVGKVERDGTAEFQLGPGVNQPADDLLLTGAGNLRISSMQADPNALSIGVIGGVDGASAESVPLALRRMRASVQVPPVQPEPLNVTRRLPRLRIAIANCLSFHSDNWRKLVGVERTTPASAQWFQRHVKRSLRLLVQKINRVTRGVSSRRPHA